MSLTTMLKGKKEVDIELQTILKNIIPTKKEFLTISGNEAFSSKYSIEAPYNLEYPYQSSVVGTAFDYMARFIISQKITSNKESVLLGLSAEYGLEIIKKYCKKKTRKTLEKKYNNGIILVTKFINNSDMSFEEILPYATYMARLEHIYRSAVLPKDIKSMLGTEESTIILDLNRLCEVFIDRFMIPNVITPESNVVFNPHFGIASKSCGGADADIYIDGTLYDFKTSKLTGYRWNDTAQIFGYYSLNCIAEQLKDTDAKLNGYEIKRLSFYKARYGEIEFVDISSMEKEKLDLAIIKINELLKTSELLMIRNILPFRPEMRTEKRVKNNFFKIFFSLLQLLILTFLFYLWMMII